MQHVCGVRGVVVRVGGVVAGLDELQPGAQRGLGAVQEVTHSETREDLQAEVSQRSAGVVQCTKSVFFKALPNICFVIPFTPASSSTSKSLSCTRCTRCKSSSLLNQVDHQLIFNLL